MSVICFSDKFLTDSGAGAAMACTTGTTPLYLGASAVSSLNLLTVCLTFWQGSMPSTDVQNSFTNSVRASDALLRFSAAGALSHSGKTITLNFGTASFGAIIAAGTIGWFNVGNTDTNTSRPMLFGTVGLSGSGADLILPKVTVAANDLWLCTNLNFNVNNTATFA